MGGRFVDPQTRQERAECLKGGGCHDHKVNRGARDQSGDPLSRTTDDDTDPKEQAESRNLLVVVVISISRARPALGAM
eukprot:9159071-Pyramimonas_sp.AAC.2